MPDFSNHTKELWNDLRNQKIYLACSGGIDSMVLLDMLFKLKFDLHVIHVNYQLRGIASDTDAELVKFSCAKQNIPCEIRTIDLKKNLEGGGNLQDEARKIRYAWFDEILKVDRNNRIALAHHSDDQIETFFMNLARKSGVMGLACMKHDHAGIVRPLLDFSKAEIACYALSNWVLWREDKSNETNKYTRNRLRNEFIPRIKLEFPEIGVSVLTLINQFQKIQLDLEKKVDPILGTIQKTHTLSLDEFGKLSELEQIELLRQLGLSAKSAPRLLDLTQRGKRIPIEHTEFSAIVRDETQFTFLCTSDVPPKLIVEQLASLPSDFNKDIAYFDAAKMKGELKLRKWEHGDRIASLGMKGTQLISDIIKDAKIDANAKAAQLVVHDDDVILWCVGLKISQKAIADANSTKIIRCSISVSAAEESELP